MVRVSDPAFICRRPRSSRMSRDCLKLGSCLRGREVSLRFAPSLWVTVFAFLVFTARSSPLRPALAHRRLSKAHRNLRGPWGRAARPGRPSCGVWPRRGARRLRGGLLTVKCGAIGAHRTHGAHGTYKAAPGDGVPLLYAALCCQSRMHALTRLLPGGRRCSRRSENRLARGRSTLR